MLNCIMDKLQKNPSERKKKVCEKNLNLIKVVTANMVF